jgi:CheY-like chemotaxis protein
MTDDRPKILLVDDYPANLLALEAGLGDLDLDLVKAASGQEALQRLAEEDFALVLLDVQMPGMDGFETAARLRKDTRSQDTPIIFVTAIGVDEASIARGYSLGAVDYLLKPFPVEALRAKVLAMAAHFREQAALERQLPEALRQEPPIDILAVDDNPANLFALEEILAGLGEHLVATLSSREALRLLLRQDFPLVLLDIRMPEISGFELAGMIRQRRPNTQIIFTTAIHKAPEDISQGYALDAVDYLFTPFSPEILRGKVRALADLIRRQKVLERQVQEIERLNQELRRSEAALRELNLGLEERVAERTQALRESQQWLQTAVRASNTGLWDWNVQTNAVYFSPEWKAQLGYGEGELAGRYEEWEGRFHPEDRD